MTAFSVNLHGITIRPRSPQNACGWDRDRNPNDELLGCMRAIGLKTPKDRDDAPDSTSDTTRLTKAEEYLPT